MTGNKRMKKAHLVIDETYHLNEAEHIAFHGTLAECHKFVEEQDTIGYKVVPMTKEEIEIFNTKEQ